MSTSSKTRNKEARKSKKRAAKAAKKATYQAWAEQGVTKKSRRAQLKARAGKKLAKDFKHTNVAAALARPTIGKPAGWVNRRAERLLGKS
jgi:hypothetical protein